MRLSIVMATAVVLGLSLGQAFGKVIIREKTKYYTITGKTGAQIARSIDRKGPKLGRHRHAIATTDSLLRVLDIKTAIKRDRCRVTSATIRLDLTYTYPRWKNRRTTSPALRKAWDRFMERVVVHEKHHGKIAQKHARAMEKELRKVRGSVSKKCRDFNRDARKRFARLSKRIDREHARFDRREGRPTARVRRLQRALYRAR